MHIRHHIGTVGELHGLPMPTEGDEAELWVMHPTGSAVAMGSSQKPDAFDHSRLEADSIELASRRSGGGAVFIDPVSTVWIDLLAPRSSAWWSNELVENFLMVGRVWQRALASLSVDAELVVDEPSRSDAARQACWAGIGWGELVIGDAKIVGLSQRRTRWGARVQAMAVLDGSSARVTDYLVASELPVISHHDLLVSAAELEAAVLANFSS